jgi:hypothetical protein
MMLKKSYQPWKVLLAATNQPPLEEVVRMVTLKGSLIKYYLPPVPPSTGRTVKNIPPYVGIVVSEKKKR